MTLASDERRRALTPELAARGDFSATVDEGVRYAREVARQVADDVGVPNQDRVVIGIEPSRQLVISREEAQALWDVLSHDSWQYDGPGIKVRAVLRRISAFLEQEAS